MCAKCQTVYTKRLTAKQYYEWRCDKCGGRDSITF